MEALRREMTGIAMEFQSAMQQIKQTNIHPIYTLHGSERFLRQELIQALKQQIELTGDIEVVQCDMQEMTLAELIAEADTFSFFADKRLLIANHFDGIASQSKQKIEDKQVKLLESYLSNPNEQTILIIVVPFDQLDKRKKLTKLLLKQSRWVDLTTLDAKTVSAYVSQYIQSDGLAMNKAAIQLLLERVSYQLSQAMNELAKLKVYGLNGQQINEETVKKLVPRTLEDNIFELTSAVLNKQMSQAVQIYQDLILLKNEPIALHALLVAQFRLMIQVKILGQKGFLEGEISKQLGVHPYRVKLATQQIKAYQVKQLLAFYHELTQVDYQMKRSYGDKTIYFYILLTKFMAM